MMAEYPANGVVSSPQKEYGYRNGQLLITAGPSEVFVSSLAWTSATNGWGPVERNTSNGESGAADGTTIRLNGVAYGPGLGVHADSDVRFNLAGQYATFTSDLGVDDEVGGNGSVKFQVWADGALLYDSGVMYASSATQTFNVSVAGKNELRLLVTNGGDNYNYDHADWANARLIKPGATADIQWLVADQLGTPRLVFDKTGALATTKRHDYLPFGEELFSSQGVRSTGLGYSGDAVRQKFTSKERDIETGLDYFLARYYSSTQGRFTSPDPFSIILLRQASPNENKTAEAFLQFIGDPRRWNRLTYAVNSPVVFTDKTGLDIMIIENGPTKDNPAGHTAMAVTGRGVYSMGNAGAEKQQDRKNNILGGGVKDYLDREIPRRDTRLTIIKTTPQQDAAAVAALENIAKTSPTLSLPAIATDNCSIRVNAALDAAGIQSGGNGLPGSASARAVLDGGLQGTATVIDVPQNSTGFLSRDLKVIQQFEPRKSSNIPPPGAPGGTPVITMPMKTKH